MANMTKRMLSMSLKKLLSKTTLDNITIQDITNDAEVSRKTFYYHFQDIYDLLDWTLQEDARHLVDVYKRQHYSSASVFFLSVAHAKNNESSRPFDTSIHF